MDTLDPRMAWWRIATALALARIATASSPACTSASACSFNGECTNFACVCTAVWSGPSCGTLNVLPGDRKAGLREVGAQQNVTTWGGAVLLGDDGQYHMWASEMTNHCSLNSWADNSQVVHAISDRPAGIYTRQAIAIPNEAHEPNVVRGPHGEYVMFVCTETGGGGDNCNKTARDNGKTSAGHDSTRIGTNYSATGANFETFMTTSATPNGPWSRQQRVISTEGWHNRDANLAAVILADNSLVGLFRSDPHGTPHGAPPGPKTPYGGSRIHLATATNYSDPGTWTLHQDELFAPIHGEPFSAEDPFVWLDAKGRFHALFHQFTGCVDPGADIPACGSHAFSEDGRTWTYGGLAFNRTATFTDGSSFAYNRRERPHLVMAKDGSTPVALSTGVTYDTSGHAYTLVQPIATA